MTAWKTTNISFHSGAETFQVDPEFGKLLMPLLTSVNKPLSKFCDVKIIKKLVLNCQAKFSPRDAVRPPFASNSKLV